jgi:predicted NUDIX family NTP pyrophosphohydrolase
MTLDGRAGAEDAAVMPVLSAGILMWRRRAQGVEVLLGHFGGPVWSRRDAGAWAIPKGLVEEGETPEAAARREFAEELGAKPEGELVPLGRIRQKGGKYVEAFALEGDLDADAIVSNLFRMEWPPRSGRFQSYPEVDRAAWFGLPKARDKILPSQIPILDLFEAGM